MESQTKVFGHPIHPMLVVFPLGLLATAVIFDIIHFLDPDGTWSQIAYYMIAAGLIGGLVSAVFGFLDWRAIRPSRAKRIGMMHGLLNAVVVVLFLVSWLLRRGDPARPDTLALVLSFLGAGIALVSAWLGGELVYRLRVGVDNEANLDAPSSI